MNIVSATSNDSEEIAKIVAMSNREVAEMFNINRQNNPKHPSFYDQAWVMSGLPLSNASVTNINPDLWL